MNARITLIGLERHLNDFYNKSITDSWNFNGEEGTEVFDASVLLASIITSFGQCEPLYTDPEYFWNMAGMWWKKHYRTFSKWFIVFSKEYEPLWDRNGYETVHEDTYDVGTNDTITKNKEVIDDDTTTHMTEIMDDDTTGHIENKVSAYDKDTYQPHDESYSTGTDDRTTQTDGTGTDDRTTNFDGNIDNDTTNDRDFDREYHSWGNWGISQTSQKLLEQEIKIQGWDIYQAMTALFGDELVVRVF